MAIHVSNDPRYAYSLYSLFAKNWDEEVRLLAAVSTISLILVSLSIVETRHSTVADLHFAGGFYIVD
jgi:hypothetical protein